MLLVGTKIRQSKINGVGLFANQFIPKGTVIWKLQVGFDLKIGKNELAKLSEPAREIFLRYAYLDSATNKYILCFDNARFINHSNTPNCIEKESPDGEEEGITVAVKDIQQGEEITENYKEFDADFDYEMSIS